MRFLKNSSGQGLIEYLIVVALMAVATIGLVRALNQTTNAKFASIIYALQGKTKRASAEAIEERQYKKKDLSDFMNGAAKREK